MSSGHVMDRAYTTAPGTCTEQLEREAKATYQDCTRHCASLQPPYQSPAHSRAH